MNRRDFLRSGALVAAGGAVIAPGGASALTGELIDRHTRPTLPFVIEVRGRPGTYAFCYPCDRISHSNQYVLRDGRLIWGEKFGGTRVNLEDGCGWVDIPNQSLDPEVIGWVKTVHQEDRAGWHQLPGGHA
ncbi:twin-arginine translocation signal domain-containing protein [Pararhodobacter aggregans]